MWISGIADEGYKQWEPSYLYYWCHNRTCDVNSEALFCEQRLGHVGLVVIAVEGDFVWEEVDLLRVSW